MKLGNRTNLADASAKGAEANREAAVAFAANVLPIIRQIEATGVSGSYDKYGIYLRQLALFDVSPKVGRRRAENARPLGNEPGD